MSNPERSHTAMNSLDQRLVRRESGVVQLLDPPFDKSAMNPGYIKGYVPGVRENGGQYTHAAIWATMAFAEMGDSKRAWELLRIINPVNHSLTPEKMATYKAEPYVVAADVYGQAPHTGRGGWTWYTGSASWLYRLMSESLLGFKRKGNLLTFAPCIPEDWKTYSMNYRFGETHYQIEVVQILVDEPETGSSISVTLDNIGQGSDGITLIDDQQQHIVKVAIKRSRQ